MKNYQLSKFRKSKINYWINVFGLSIMLSAFPAKKALSGYPSLYPVAALLNSDYTECKAKAIEVANLVFSEVRDIPEQSGYFRLIGTTPKTKSALICIKSDQGTYFVMSTSNDSFADVNDEGKSIYQRVSQYMLSD